MFVEKVQSALNQQINMELQAHYTYLAAADYFEGMGLKGFSQWIFNHAEEEMAHAMKIYQFIHSRRGRVEALSPCLRRKENFGSPQAVMEGALKARAESYGVDRSHRPTGATWKATMPPTAFCSGLSMNRWRKKSSWMTLCRSSA